ncbi:hypothetical protein KIN20_029846 [Parelaphostrongylus tenuis]|uniref:G-protein coupled receptors family 1 profile domain-containing protein n=1 Tax=Parelaphostrongylus tenuis TaxID=148309 RepID=A0AAD5R365_PARTN|nr:hypothetical protein KIN20_029846 [Parelaphostrongylus tenuis]
MKRFDFFIVTYVAAFLLVIPTTILNLLILFLFNKLKKTNKPFPIVVFLTVTDLLHAVTVSPYIVYLIVKWNRTMINLDPYMVLLSSVPLIIQLKINLTLTGAIALDRALALWTPIHYRQISPSVFANTALLIGLALAACDLILEFKSTKFDEVLNCGALGCFISPSFRSYWGTSNMVLSFIVFLLTAVVVVKLQYIRTTSKKTQKFLKSGKNTLVKANYSALSFLLCSLLFLTLPSVVVGSTELFGEAIFKFAGPLNLVGLLAAGCSNSIVLVILNNDLRTLTKRLIHKSNPTIRSITIVVV